MLLNEYIIIYFLFSACSFISAAIGAGCGILTLSKWKTGQSPEDRYQIENKLYLSSSALFTGACIRLIMIPLWFFMLFSIIPLVPGAMCLAGVHQAVKTYSWIASLLKVVLPLFYFSWIMMTVIDKKFVTPPFFKARHYLLFSIILLIFAEIFFDLKYLISLRPVQVTCCTALFDFSDGTVPEVFTESHWYFVITFCLLLMIQAILMMWFQKRKATYILIVICSIALIVTLPLSLHSQLSPLILEAPFHHCIFCLLQINMPVLSGTMFLFISAYLSFTYGLMGFIGQSKDDREKINIDLKKIRLTGLVLYAIGFILLFIPALWALIQFYDSPL